MMKRIILLILIFSCFESYAQRDLYNSNINDLSDVESFLWLDFVPSLPIFKDIMIDWENNTIGTVACKKNDKQQKADVTYIYYKANPNKYYVIYFSQEINNEDIYTNNAYVGFMEMSYGETLNESLKLLPKSVFILKIIFIQKQLNLITVGF